MKRNKNFVCYNKTLATNLIDMGVKCVGVQADRNNTSYDVWYFEDSLQIREYTRLFNQIKAKRIEIERANKR